MIISYIQTAEEKLNAFKTVTAFNAQELEGKRFGEKVDAIFGLAKKEAYMTGIFWGMSGLTGNLALLCLLGYGTSGSHWTYELYLPSGGTLVSRGDITVGDLTSLLMYSA